MELLPDHRNEVTWLAECERIPNVSRVWHSNTTYVVRLRRPLIQKERLRAFSF